MTPRAFTFTIAAGVLAAGLACTGSTGGNSANVEACYAYVDHMNTLTPCMGVTYNRANLCAEVHQTSVDMTAFYDCLREHSACEGPEPILELDSCEPPIEGGA